MKTKREIIQKYIYIKTVVGISQKNKQNSYYEEFSENRTVYEGSGFKDFFQMNEKKKKSYFQFLL